jgi:hypothetical protein
MPNRSKAIGTRGETAVTRYAREHGFPLADRRPLKGINDEGDVLLTVGLIAEVKAGKSAQNASLGQVRAWLAETERERVNARADHAILVVQRRGHGPERVGEWECWTRLALNDYPAVFTVTLHDGLALLRRLGWGDPL